jgi:hypothetical protein
MANQPGLIDTHSLEQDVVNLPGRASLEVQINTIKAYASPDIRTGKPDSGSLDRALALLQKVTDTANVLKAGEQNVADYNAALDGVDDGEKATAKVTSTNDTQRAENDKQFASLNQQEVAQAAYTLPSQREDYLDHVTSRDEATRKTERKKNPALTKFLESLPDEKSRQEYLAYFTSLVTAEEVGKELAVLNSLTDNERKKLANIKDPNKRKDELKRIRTLQFTKGHVSSPFKTYKGVAYTARQWREFERSTGIDTHTAIFLETIASVAERDEMEDIIRKMTPDELGQMQAILVYCRIQEIRGLAALPKKDRQKEILRLASLAGENAQVEVELLQSTVPPQVKEFIRKLPVKERRSMLAASGNVDGWWAANPQRQAVFSTLSNSELERLPLLTQAERDGEVDRLVARQNAGTRTSENVANPKDVKSGLIEHEVKLFDNLVSIQGDSAATTEIQAIKNMSVQERGRFQSALLKMDPNEFAVFINIPAAQRGMFIEIILGEDQQNIDKRAKMVSVLNGLSPTEIKWLARVDQTNWEAEANILKGLNIADRTTLVNNMDSCTVFEMDEMVGMDFLKRERQLKFLSRLSPTERNRRELKIRSENMPIYSEFKTKLEEYGYFDMTLEQRIRFLNDPANIKEIKDAFPGMNTDLTDLLDHQKSKNNYELNLRTKGAGVGDMNAYYDNLLTRGLINQNQYDDMMNGLNKITKVFDGTPDNFGQYLLNLVGIDETTRAEFSNIIDSMKIYSPYILYAALIALSIIGLQSIPLAAAVTALGILPAHYFSERLKLVNEPVIRAREKSITAKGEFQNSVSVVIGSMNELSGWLSSGRTIGQLKEGNPMLYERLVQLNVIENDTFKPEAISTTLYTAANTYESNLDASRKAVETRKEQIKGKKPSEIRKMNLATA